MSINKATIKNYCCAHERANDGLCGRGYGLILIHTSIYMLLITFAIYILKGEEAEPGERLRVSLCVN